MPSKPPLNPIQSQIHPEDTVTQQAAVPAAVAYQFPEEVMESGGSGMPPRMGTYSRPPPYELETTKLIAWCPPDADPHLTGVMVRQGSIVTQAVWWSARADRVTELVMREPEPKQAADWACRALRVVGVDKPRQAGESLVECNWELRQNLYLSMAANQDPFPASASEESEGVREAIAETDLELWINLAEPRMR